MKSKLLKATLLTLTAIVLVVATVFTTIAYLTSSAAVTNTFTVGNVGIHMYESRVDTNGQAIGDDSNINGDMKDANGNNYHLVPGKTYVKDPTIYIQAGSDDSYLFVKIRNTIRTIEAGYVNPAVNNVTPTIRKQMEANGWVFLKETPTGTVYYYAKMNSAGVYEKDESGNPLPKHVGGTSNVLKVDVFQQFTIDSNADISLYGGAKVNITAFAIQVAGFEDNAQKAWETIESIYPYEGGSGVNPSEPTT